MIVSKPFLKRSIATIGMIATGASFLWLSLACRANEEVEVKDIFSQSSWVMNNDQVEIAVSKLGAQMAPVTFYRDSAQRLQPFYVSPWQGEGLNLAYCPVLVPLRGDFFCLPFGGNETAYNGEKFPPHGETAGSPWSLDGFQKEGGVTTLNVAIKTIVRKGEVKESISLVDGENAIYTKTSIYGFTGKTTFSHHAILAMPEKDGVINISISPIKFGMTCPYLFGNPKEGEYQSLAQGTEFKSLSQVPVIFKGQPDTDCSSFPARRGYADLLQTFDKPRKKNIPAWIAAVNTATHCIWYALKDPRVMPGRVLWMENHGRYDKPWDGRNNCLGLEDGCTFFDKGIAESIAPNILNKMSIPTFVELTGDKPFVVNYIEGVVKVPEGFKKVAEVDFAPGEVEFVSTIGVRVTAKVRHEFLFDGKVKQ